MTAPTTSRYRYLAVDQITGNVRLEVPLVSVTAARQLNAAGAFSASMPLAGIRQSDGTADLATQQACFDATESGRSSIAVIRDGTCLGEWRITSRPSRKNDGSPIQIEGEYITGYLAEVIPSFTGLAGDLPAAGYPGPASTPPGPGTDQLQIAWDLVAQCADPIPSTTAPPGSRGLALVMPTRASVVSGILLTQTDWPGQNNNALAMLTTIQQLVPGFDWDIDVTLVGQQIRRMLVLSYPHRGVDAGTVIIQPEKNGRGGQITDFEANEDGSLLATQIIGVGSTTGPAGQVTTVSNNAAMVPGYPLMQKVSSQSATTDPGMLQMQADAVALNARTSIVPPTLVILADGNPQLGAYTVGDFITVHVGVSDNFPYGYTLKVRIIGIQLAPPVAGPETVALTVALIPTS